MVKYSVPGDAFTLEPFVLPLSRPILITVGLFEAFGYWNSWYHAMLYISANHRELFPLQYVLYNLQKNVEFMAANENISGAVIVNLPTETFCMAVVVLIVLPDPPWLSLLPQGFFTGSHHGWRA